MARFAAALVCSFLVVIAIIASNVQGQSPFPSCPNLAQSEFCGACPLYCEQPAPQTCPAPQVVNQFSLVRNICFDNTYKRLSEYASGARNDYYYTVKWTPNCQAGYWHYGELAHVAGNQLPGTKPVYQYNIGNNNLASPSPQPGATNTGVEFYISETRQPGQFALMRFNLGVRNRLAFDYQADIVQQQGYTFQETLGYTYPACPSVAF